MSARRKRERAARQRCSQRDACPRCGSGGSWAQRIRLTRAERRRRGRKLSNSDQHRGMRIVFCDHPWHESARPKTRSYQQRLDAGLEPYTRSVRGAR